MRMEELSDNRYIKGTDTVERYLLNLVQEYFKTSNITATTSREYIIKKAVDRMKEEMSYDSIGVLSITLPDGEKRTGAVTITLQDLNGEPLIENKLSAFNVDFGTEMNTACEGDDPRLSDARKPLEHQHEVSDIVGLQGILSTLLGKVERVDDFLHEHKNKDVLDILVYTGNNTEIDLTILDTLENKINTIVDEIRNEIIEYKAESNDKVDIITKELNNTKTILEEEKKYVLDTNKEYYESSKEYVDTEIQKVKDSIADAFDDLVTLSSLADILKTINNVYTYAGTMEINLNNMIDFDGANKQDKVINISNSIKLELENRNQLLKDCQIEIFLQYLDTSTNKLVCATMPYIISYNGAIDSIIQLNTMYDSNLLQVTFDSVSKNVPENIKNAKILYNVYAKQSITLE